MRGDSQRDVGSFPFLREHSAAFYRSLPRHRNTLDSTWKKILARSDPLNQLLNEGTCEALLTHNLDGLQSGTDEIIMRGMRRQFKRKWGKRAEFFNSYKKSGHFMAHSNAVTWTG